METIRQIYNQEVHDRLKEIVTDYEGHDASTDLMLSVDGVDYSDRLENGDWQISEGSPAWTLQANLSGVLSTSEVLNSPARLSANIAGIFLSVFEGDVSVVDAFDDYSSSILAATPGQYLDKIPLRVPVGYVDKPPEWVMRDALYRIKRYDKGRITIPPFSRPIIRKLLREGDGFEDNQYPKDILDSVAELVSASYYDEPVDYGHTVYRDVGTGEGQPEAWRYDAQDDKQVYAWSSPAPATPGEQFTSVVVRERKDNGTLRFWQEYPIFYTNLKHRPQQGQIMFVDFSTTLDPDDDPLDTLTKADAQRRAKKEADSLGRMLHFGSFDAAFNPFLKQNNVLTLESTREDDKGRYRTIWRAVITDLTHPFDANSIYTTIGYRSVIASEVRLPDPPIILPGVTPNIVSFRDLRFAVMETDEDIVIDDSVEWAIDLGEDILFTDDAPVTEEAEDIVINR